MGTASAVGLAAAADAKPADAAAAPAPDVAGTIPIAFDREAFRAVVQRPYPHRQVAAPQTFSSATVALSHFRNALAAYADPDGFAAGPNSLHCAAVLYAGRSYALALGDAMYAKYPIGLLNDEEMRPNDTSMRAYWSGLKKNPLDQFFQPLAEQGVSLFVCNNALSNYAVDIARRIATPAAPVTRAKVIAVHTDLRENLVRGAMVVPAGVAALIALQEAGFTYLP